MNEHSPLSALPVYAVIMAGGSGERFWPASRTHKPKQLLPLGTNGTTMLEEAIERIAPLIPVERILLITSAVLRDPILEAVPSLPTENVIAEPCKRNTAPCLALATAEILTREANGSALMAVLTADHFIGNAEQFRQDVTVALQQAYEHGSLVTLGIAPTRPETGYGYIEVEQANPTPGKPVTVRAFCEKPTLDTAMTYIHDGKHLWNSGMFFWRADVLQQVMIEHLPEVGKAIQPLSHALRNVRTTGAPALQAATELRDLFAALPDISIDYGVMERATNVHVVPARFVWDDVGSWDAMKRLGQENDLGTVSFGEVLDLESRNCVLVNNSAEGHILGVLDVEDLIVVTTSDATMVCSRHRAQDVKKLVAALRHTGRGKVL